MIPQPKQSEATNIQIWIQYFQSEIAHSSAKAFGGFQRESK